MAGSERSSPARFDDQRGSELFDAITCLEEYYQTRTECLILKQNAAAMAAGMDAGSELGIDLIEYGSGSSLKTRLLLEALPLIHRYIPVDISREHLALTCQELRREYPGLNVLPLAQDFTRTSLPSGADDAHCTRVVFFPGSTVGNFHPHEAATLLARIRRLVGRGGYLLIGVDLKKDKRVLEAAYNDRKGITAHFNLNLLHRLNRELDGDFDVNRFVHRAFYDEQAGRIEMHLVSLDNQEVRVGGFAFHFQKGETIHTENSYKYSVDGFRRITESSGFHLLHSWVDDLRLFSVQLLTGS